ncbi:MAG: hypothetical protein GYA02_18455 [Clostridiaceae bacterium]|nr:hypothetical protein [Clostridiaceae bacterium]
MSAIFMNIIFRIRAIITEKILYALLVFYLSSKECIKRGCFVLLKFLLKTYPLDAKIGLNLEKNAEYRLGWIKSVEQLAALLPFRRRC